MKIEKNKTEEKILQLNRWYYHLSIIRNKSFWFL